MKVNKFIILFFISLMTFGCGSSTNSNKVVVVGVSLDPVILDPPMYTEIKTHTLNYQIYNRLFELDDSGKVIAGLAKEVPELEENGTLYTISIKEGVKFHNGSDLTSDDVIYSFERAAFADKSQMKSVFAMMYDMKKIDDYTFSFKTGKLKPNSGVKDSDLKSFEERSKYYEPYPFPSQLNQLTWLAASILDKETMEKSEQDGTIKDYGITWAVGTGPYQFESWLQGDNVVLVKFTNYFNKDNINSSVEKLVFKTIKDPSALKTSFITKEVDVLANIDPIDIDELENNGGVIIYSDGYYGYHYVSFNMNSPRVGQVNSDNTPDKDGVYDLESPQAKLRMALVYAINPADINNSVDIMNGTGKVTLQFIESLPYGKVTNYAGTRLEEASEETGYYNPKKAKEIFDSLPEELKKPASIKASVLAGSIHVKEAIIIKDQVKKVLGVDLIDLQQIALSELTTRRIASDPNVWDIIIGYISTDDTYYIFGSYDRYNTSTLGEIKYYDKNAQKWIDLGNISMDPEKRNEAYRNAAIEILKSFPRLPLVAFKNIAASQKYITGITITPSGTLRLENVDKTK